MARAFLSSESARQDWARFYGLADRAKPIEVLPRQWLVSGYRQVLEVMRHPAAELGAPFPVTKSPIVNELFLSTLPYESREEHRRLRALTTPALARGLGSQFADVLSMTLSDHLLPAVFNTVGYDVVGGVGSALPTLTSCMMLDIPRRDWDLIDNWATTLYSQIGRYDQSDAEIDEAERAHAELASYVGRWTRTEPEVVGGVGRALIERWRSGELSEEQVLGYFALFLFTGRDTLTYAIANALWFLGNTPDVFGRIQRSPQLAEAAFNEIMRMWGPVRVCIRQLSAPFRSRGWDFDTGSVVFLLVHAANRDPDRFDKPDAFRWDRLAPARLAFGAGAHGCLGTAVGTMVGTCLLQLLAGRCATIDATPSTEQARFIPSLPILGVEGVRVYATPEGRS